MWNQFILQNAHFALSIFAALVCFAVFWLYYDALPKKAKIIEWVKPLGFLSLSFSFLLSAAHVESSILTTVLISSQLIPILEIVLRIAGFSAILVGVLPERILARPALAAVVGVPLQLSLLTFLHLLSPLLAAAITVFYARKAFTGLEAHLRKVSFAFGFLTLSELFSLATLFRASTNTAVFSLVAPFGFFWITQRIFLLIACVILGRWVFGYLLKQFKPQLFFITNVMIVVIFLISTMSFTGLLLKNIQDETFNQLTTDLKVLQFALDARHSEHLSDAVLVSKDPLIATAVISRDRASLNQLSQQYLLTKNYSSLLILDDKGQVVARGEDVEKIGGFLGDDLIVRRALGNTPSSSLQTVEGVLSPTVLISGAAPIQQAGKVIGVVVVSTQIDNAYVDGIKKATGLEASIYGNNVLAATTLLSPDGKNRLVGIKEENQRVVGNVIGEGNTVNVPINIANAPFFASYIPLNDIDGSPVGMISVARTQESILQTAGRSIELTFIIAIGMLVLSIVPSFLIARYMAEQL